MSTIETEDQLPAATPLLSPHLPPASVPNGKPKHPRLSHKRVATYETRGNSSYTVLTLHIVRTAPLDFFVGIPREIRDQIYEIVFTSPNGCIVLIDFYSNKPSHLNEAIRPCSPYTGTVNVSCLRTNSQFYAECKDLLFKFNQVQLWPSQLTPALRSKNILTFERIQHLTLTVDLKGREDYDFLANLEGLVTRPSSNLRKITFIFEAKHIPDKFMDPDYDMHADSRHWKCLRPTILLYLRFLRNARRYLSHVERKLIFTCGDFNGFFDWTHMVSPATNEIFEIDTIDGIRELNDAFGGELWEGAVLCYKDGVKLAAPFRVFREHYKAAVARNAAEDAAYAAAAAAHGYK